MIELPLQYYLPLIPVAGAVLFWLVDVTRQEYRKRPRGWHPVLRLAGAAGLNLFWVGVFLAVCFAGQVLLYRIAPGVILYR